MIECSPFLRVLSNIAPWRRISAGKFEPSRDKNGASQMALTSRQIGLSQNSNDKNLGSCEGNWQCPPNIIWRQWAYMVVLYVQTAPVHLDWLVNFNFDACDSRSWLLANIPLDLYVSLDRRPFPRVSVGQAYTLWYTSIQSRSTTFDHREWFTCWNKMWCLWALRDMTHVLA